MNFYSSLYLRHPLSELTHRTIARKEDICFSFRHLNVKFACFHAVIVLFLSFIVRLPSKISSIKSGSRQSDFIFFVYCPDELYFEEINLSSQAVEKSFSNRHLAWRNQGL